MTEHYEPVSTYVSYPLREIYSPLKHRTNQKNLRYKQHRASQRSYLSLYRFSHATTGLAILATSCTCDWSPLRCIVNVSLYQHRLGGILHRKKSTHFFHPYCNLFYNVLYTELNYCAFKLMYFIICELLGIPEILYQVLLRICMKTTIH